MAFRPRPSGRFRHAIDIERRADTDDGMGGEQEAWVTIAAKIPACIEDSRGGESVQAQRLSSISAVDIHVRPTADFDVLPSDRLVNSRTGELYSVKWVGCLDEDGRSLTIVATRGEVSRG